MQRQSKTYQFNPIQSDSYGMILLSLEKWGHTNTFHFFQFSLTMYNLQGENLFKIFTLYRRFSGNKQTNTFRAAAQRATTKLRSKKPLQSKGTIALCMAMSLGAAMWFSSCPSSIVLSCIVRVSFSRITVKNHVMLHFLFVLFRSPHQTTQNHCEHL